MTTNNCDWYEGCLRAGEHQCPACEEWFCSGHLDESGHCLQCAVDLDDDEGQDNQADIDLEHYWRLGTGLVD